MEKKKFIDEFRNRIYIIGSKDNGKYILTLQQADQLASELHDRCFKTPIEPDNKNSILERINELNKSCEWCIYQIVGENRLNRKNRVYGIQSWASQVEQNEIRIDELHNVIKIISKDLSEDQNKQPSQTNFTIEDLKKAFEGGRKYTTDAFNEELWDFDYDDFKSWYEKIYHIK